MLLCRSPPFLGEYGLAPPRICVLELSTRCESPSPPEFDQPSFICYTVPRHDGSERNQDGAAVF